MNSLPPSESTALPSRPDADPADAADEADGAGGASNADAEPRLELRAPVWPALLGLVFSGLLGIVAWSNPTWGWPFLLLVWVGFGNLLLSLSPRNQLELSRWGLRYGVFWRTQSFRWSDIAVFTVCDLERRRGGSRHQGVGLIFTPAYREQVHQPPRDYRIRPYDRLLRFTYGKTPAELVRLLEDWKARSGATAAPEPAPAAYLKTNRADFLLKCREVGVVVILVTSLMVTVKNWREVPKLHPPGPLPAAELPPLEELGGLKLAGGPVGPRV